VVTPRPVFERDATARPLVSPLGHQQAGAAATIDEPQAQSTSPLPFPKCDLATAQASSRSRCRYRQPEAVLRPDQRTGVMCADDGWCLRPDQRRGVEAGLALAERLRAGTSGVRLIDRRERHHSIGANRLCDDEVPVLVCRRILDREGLHATEVVEWVDDLQRRIARCIGGDRRPRTV